MQDDVKWVRETTSTIKYAYWDSPSVFPIRLQEIITDYWWPTSWSQLPISPVSDKKYEGGPPPWSPGISRGLPFVASSPSALYMWVSGWGEEIHYKSSLAMPYLGFNLHRQELFLLHKFPSYGSRLWVKFGMPHWSFVHLLISIQMSSADSPWISGGHGN